MNGLAYKTNAAEVFERLLFLIARQAQDLNSSPCSSSRRKR